MLCHLGIGEQVDREEVPHAFARAGFAVHYELHFVVLTLHASELVGRFHHRMPAMLRGDQVQAWLDGAALGGRDGLDEWFARSGPEDLEARPVSKRVNHSDNDDPSLLDEVEPPSPQAVQTSLFGDVD